MDTYPSEFTAHILPLLFVAGLGSAPPPPAAPASAPAATASTSTSVTTAAPSPSPPVAAETPPPNDPFAALFSSLRKTLQPKKGFPVWNNSRGTTHDFHVVLVEKGVRFPPLKARPTSTQQQPNQPLHSPISPLSPSSPLYPDGIMAPIWIRKHREMIPSVFILVLRLVEYPSSTSQGPLDLGKKEEDEHQWDSELVKEIIERKRTTLERGIKLAVILVCSRQLLDDPSLDARLSHIRRQSGLDSRASLFVISPVPQAEVVNFVMSFKAELYPAALDYYREHARRVRRKRARQVPKGKLSEKGWNVRYDYKMAIFSEMRGETEVALKLYEDCYDTLVEMFSNTTLLTPRTKRWAEAKVLADCLTVKISKVYLYLNDSSRAVSQLHRHVERFRELSNGWEIGEQTFEFWSWLSKQYRLFADLVAIATRAGFRLPSLRPPPTPRALPGLPPPATPGLIPLNVLLHPGYYFYLAGTCAVQRRDRFRTLAQPVKTEDGTTATVTPAVAHEMKVDHAELIIDLYTKAYEFFKAHKTSRMSLFVASQIALTHFEAGKHDMALKFNERIARTYRRERWRDILDSIVQLSYQSAMKIGDHDSAVNCLFGLLASESRIPLDQRALHALELLDLLRTISISATGPIAINVDMTELAPLLQCQLVFFRPTSDIGQLVPFQLSLISLPGTQSARFTFSKLQVQLNDGSAPIVISHSELEGLTEGKIKFCKIGTVGDERDLKARLNWPDDTTLVLAGVAAAKGEIGLTVSSVTLTLQEGTTVVNLLFKPDVAAASPIWRLETSPPSTIQLLHSNPSVCSVRPRSIKTKVLVTHASPAYLDEEFAVHVDVTNEDDVTVEIFLDILLQPGEDQSRNLLVVDDQTSFSLIKAVSLGTLSPTASLRKTFRLLCVGQPGDRQLDVSIHAQATLLSETSIPSSLIPSASEVLRTLTIPAVPPLFASFDTHFHQKRLKVQGLLDFEEPTGWEGASQVTLISKLCARGPWDLKVVNLRLVCDNSPGVRIQRSSLEKLPDPLSLVWKLRDCFNAIFTLDVKASAEDSEHPAPVTGAHLEVLWCRTDDVDTTSRTLLPIPPLLSRPLQPRITLVLPPYLTLHTPSPIRYKFANPTAKLLTLSLQVESSDTFVFAGPRKTPIVILAPLEEREFELVVIPFVVGKCVLPRLRVLEKDTSASGAAAAASDEEAGLAVRTKELEVVAEQAVEDDVLKGGLENDLTAAALERREDDHPLTVLVLPR